MTYSPTIVAHRGLHEDCPENSLRAFREASRWGCDWVECYVWPSADGVPVVIHDPWLDRTTELSGAVCRRRWDELKSARLRADDGTLDERERLPHLTDVTEAAMSMGGLLVEIKPSDARTFVHDTVSLLRDARGQWVLQSFDETNLIHAIVADEGAAVALLVEDRGSLERGIANGWNAIHLRHDLLDVETSGQLHDRGITVGAWTVNTDDDLTRVMDLRADWIITDAPLAAMQLLGRFPNGWAPRDS